jgi:hypothetical protein
VFKSERLAFSQKIVDLSYNYNYNGVLKFELFSIGTCSSSFVFNELDWIVYSVPSFEVCDTSLILTIIVCAAIIASSFCNGSSTW